VDITNSSKGIWPNEWTIRNNSASESYYLGIRLKENNSFLVGWLKLDIDKTTGEIKIIDKNLTSNNYILIDK